MAKEINGLKGNFEVPERKRKIIKVSHCDGYLCFVPPIEGPGTYIDTRKRIYNRELGIPTMGEAASLIYACILNETEPLAKEILGNLEQHPFWVNTILNERPQGFHAIDHPEVTRDGRIVIPRRLGISREDLQSRAREDDRVHYSRAVYSGDRLVRPEKTVRYTALESVSGEISSSKLPDVRKVRAQAGRQGILKLTEIAKRCGKNVFVGGSNNPTGNNIKIPALYIHEGRLVIAGDDYNSLRNDGWGIGIDRNSSIITEDQPRLLK